MRYLLFDIDGTLLETDGAGSHAIAAALSAEFGVSEPSMRLNFSGKTDGYLLSELLKRNGLPADASHLQRFRRSYLRRFTDSMRYCGGRLLPGVESLLDRCQRSDDVRCFVMTGNCVASGQEKLRHFNLLERFEAVFGGDHDRSRDELAVRTRQSLRQSHQCGVDDEIVVIGDTPADVLCGQTIDAATVAVATGRYDLPTLRRVEPDLACQTLCDGDVVSMLLRRCQSA